jgi:hypothetical protein
VHEARGEFADALHCVRAARAAEGRHRRDVEAARGTLLDNCGSARREETRLVAQVAALLGEAGTGCAAGSEADTGPLGGEVGVGSAAQQTDPEPLESEIVQADSVEAEVGEVEALGAEIAQAELIEAGLGEAEASERVAEEQVAEEQVAEEQVAEEPIPVSPETASGESPSVIDSWQAGARHRRGAGTLVSVSDLLPASALAVGRSGRRRAEDRPAETPTVEIGDADPEPSSAGERGAADRSDGPPVPLVIYPLSHQPPSESSATLERAATDDDPSEEPENSSQPLRELPVAGPPPAPTPRSLDWQPADEDEAGDEAQMGLGDLLAEALAAYQESRDIHAGARSAGMRSDDGSTTADPELDVSRYPGLRTGRTAGLALAPKPIDASSGGPNSVDADADDPAAAVTNPLLRLPNLTAEPRWGSA